MKTITILAALSLTGCASIQPNYYTMEFTHTSHLSQHFGDKPTNYGYGMLSLGAYWESDAGFFLHLREGIVTEACKTFQGHQECGGLYGPREVFSGTVGYKFGER